MYSSPTKSLTSSPDYENPLRRQSIDVLPYENGRKYSTYEHDQQAYIQLEEPLHFSPPLPSQASYTTIAQHDSGYRYATFPYSGNLFFIRV